MAKSNQALLCTSALAALLLAPGSPACAQDTAVAADKAPRSRNVPAADAAPTAENAPADAVGGGVEEIVVTAQFRAQNLQRTPLAITAISGDMLTARSQTNIAEITGQAPSVTLKPQGAAYGPSLVASIRGVGQFDFNPALEPGVGIYVDDVYYATLSGSVFDLLDLDRVEVLRGPQGTLAGRNSIGGAIKLYSKKPTGSGDGYLSATYGSRQRIDLRGSADFKLADDLYARIAGVSKNQDGYIKRLDYGCVFPASGIPAQLTTGRNCVLAKDGNVNYIAGRGQLRYDPGNGLEVNIIGDYTHDDRRSAGSVLTYANYVGPGDVNPYGSGIRYDNRFVPPSGSFYNYATFANEADGAQPGYRAQDRSDFKGWGVSGQIDWALSDRAQIVSISAYRAYRLRFANDDDYSPLAVNLGDNNLSFWSFSQEVRLNGSIGDAKAIEYTLGGYYSDQRSVYGTLQDVRYAALPAFIGDDPVKASTKAAFAHLSWHATDRLTLIGGLRYTDESKSYTFVRTNPDGSPHPVLGALDGLTGRYSGNRVDYRANVQYEWTPSLMTYAQVSTGFKGGGVNPRPFNAAQVQPFDPETLTSYEVGIKSELFDRLVRLNLAGFYSRYKAIQLQLNACPQFGGPGPCALQANAGNADIRGVELETTIRPVKGFIIDGTLSYLDFKYTSISPQAGGPGGVEIGFVPPYVPAWKWSVGAQYAIPLGDVGSLTPRIDAAYQGRLYSSAVNAPTNRIAAYVLANARLTWRNTKSDWEVSFEVTNLFDKYYFLSSQDQAALGAGLVNAQPGRPREWAVTVRKNF